MVLPAAAWLWVRFMARPMTMRRRTGNRELVEGGRVEVLIEVRSDEGPLPSRALVVERVAGLPERDVPVVRSGHELRGRYVLEDVPRGRYALDAADLVLGDPFGLAEARIALERHDTLLVYPRVFDLDGVFTDAGAAGGDEGRALLHRTAGYDLHSIRDFQQGESLRRVHWRSTAKRRKLMVKELTETPRDEAAVLLDGERITAVGPRGASSYDASVRAAASLLSRMVTLGQRCSLVLHGSSRQRLRIQAGGGEWGSVMAALAAVEPDAERPLHVDAARPDRRLRRGRVGRRRPPVRGQRRADAGAGRPAARAPLRTAATSPWCGSTRRRSPGGRQATGRRRPPRCSSPGRACRSPGCGPATTSAPCCPPPPSPGSTRMRERLALTALWAAFLGFQWAQLERPWASLADVVVLARRRHRAGGAVGGRPPRAGRRRPGRLGRGGRRRGLRPLPVGDRPSPLPDPRLGRRGGRRRGLAGHDHADRHGPLPRRRRRRRAGVHVPAGRARVAADRPAAGRCWPSASASPPSPSPARWSRWTAGSCARCCSWCWPR